MSGLPVCTRCGHSNPQPAASAPTAARRCAPGALRSAPRRPPRPSPSPVSRRTTPRSTGQTPLPSLSPEAQAAVDALPLGFGAAGGAPRAELGQPLPAGQRADHGRPSPAERHLPGRRDGLAPPRGVPARSRRALHRLRRRKPQRHVRQPRADRRRRRWPMATRSRSASTGWSSTRASGAARASDRRGKVHAAHTERAVPEPAPPPRTAG